jgi:hypothetical protein
MNGRFYRDMLRSISEAGSRLEVYTHNGIAIGELLNVFSGRCQTVVVVLIQLARPKIDGHCTYQITQSAEQTQRRALLVCNNQSLLDRSLNIKVLNNRPCTTNCAFQQQLVHFLCIIRSLLQESLVTNLFNVCFVFIEVGTVIKEALVDKIAT